MIGADVFLLRLGGLVNLVNIDLISQAQSALRRYNILVAYMSVSNLMPVSKVAACRLFDPQPHPNTGHWLLKAEKNMPIS